MNTKNITCAKSWIFIAAFVVGVGTGVYADSNDNEAFAKEGKAIVLSIASEGITFRWDDEKIKADGVQGASGQIEPSEEDFFDVVVALSEDEYPIVSSLLYWKSEADDVEDISMVAFFRLYATDTPEAALSHVNDFVEFFEFDSIDAEAVQAWLDVMDLEGPIGFGVRRLLSVGNAQVLYLLASIWPYESDEKIRYQVNLQFHVVDEEIKTIPPDGLSIPFFAIPFDEMPGAVD